MDNLELRIHRSQKKNLKYAIESDVYIIRH